ncbi:MAG: hypothetical protein ABJN40_22355 [Sneathiella sp.]
MIGDTYAPYAPNIIQKAAHAYNSPPVQGAGAVEKKEEAAVTVEVSEAGKQMSSLLENIPNFSLDPAFHLKNAESQLKDLMSKFGISAETEVSIKSKGDGTYTVSGDHPLMGEVEKMINSDDPAVRDLRNSLAGAHTGSVLQRIAAAQEVAVNAADANPAKADMYYSWLVNTAKSASNMGFSMSMSNGEMTGTLIDREGNAVAANEGLTLPA